MAEESEPRPYDWKLNKAKDDAGIAFLTAQCIKQSQFGFKAGDQASQAVSKSCIQRITHSYMAFLKTYNDNLPTYVFKPLGGEDDDDEDEDEEEEEEEAEEAEAEEAEAEAEPEAEEQGGDDE